MKKNETKMVFLLLVNNNWNKKMSRVQKKNIYINLFSFKIAKRCLCQTKKKIKQTDRLMDERNKRPAKVWAKIYLYISKWIIMYVNFF